MKNPFGILYTIVGRAKRNQQGNHQTLKPWKSVRCQNHGEGVDTNTLPSRLLSVPLNGGTIQISEGKVRELLHLVEVSLPGHRAE